MGSAFFFLFHSNYEHFLINSKNLLKLVGERNLFETLTAIKEFII